MCGGFAVMCGLEGQAVVEDGRKAEGWDQEQNGVGDKVFHVFVWRVAGAGSLRLGEW